MICLFHYLISLDFYMQLKCSQKIYFMCTASFSVQVKVSKLFLEMHFIIVTRGYLAIYITLLINCQLLMVMT